jgi:glyoxylase-like metal-dependent hydrolase (beta-lactamase superfamily II)
MELRFCPLFSGSSGNALYLGCGNTHLLVDAGMSGAKVTAEMDRVGLHPGDLSGILVTHEHADHIAGVGILSRRYDIPIYANEGTWAAMRDKLGNISEKNIMTFETGADFHIGALDITTCDRMWFGVLMVMLMEFGLMTPPVGMCCYVMAGIAPDMTLGQVFKGTAPFLLGVVVALVFVIIFPEIAVWMPSFMRYG